jgi:DNA polymerase-3 subunit epsilon
MLLVSLDANGDGDIEETHDLLVRPEGWTLDPACEAAKINGLTHELMLEKGVPVGEVLDLYEWAVKENRVVACYGAQFDCKIMRGEFRRAGRDDLFTVTRNTCCMRGAQRLVKIPGKRGWPSLAQAHGYLCGPGTFPGTPHKALSDAHACLAVLRELIRRGAIITPAVHYAKRGDGDARGPGF